MLRLLVLSLLICFFDIASARAMRQTLQIDGDHGKLSAIMQIPDNVSSYPMVILLHGFYATKETPLLDDIANYLQAAKIASVRFDFNGHGQSEGNILDMTIPNEIADAKKVYDYVQQLPEVTTISLAGHSQGGVVASMLAGQLGTNAVKSLCLLASAGFLRDYFNAGKLFIAQQKANFLAPQYIDLLSGHQVGQAFVETLKTLPIYEDAGKYQGPVLIIHGLNDEIVPYSYSELYHQIYADSTLILLPGADHNFIRHRREVLHLTTDFFIRQLMNDNNFKKERKS